MMTEPVPPAGGGPSGPEGGTARYSVPEAARALGISERGVRKRITAGTLPAHKEGTAWVVLLPSTTGAVPTEPAAHGAVPERGPGAAPGGTVDLAPMAELIADLTRQNQELATAAALWQERARYLGERLAALETGPIAADVPQERDSGPLRGDVATEASQVMQASPVPQASAMRRWWRRIIGAE